MRLSQDTIYQILIAHNEGQKRSAIAERFHVDGSTVRYHVEKFEEKYGTTTAVYALVKPKKKKVCVHPSLKCLVCGKAQDNIQREDLLKIQNLTKALDEANACLERHGFDPVEPGAV